MAKAYKDMSEKDLLKNLSSKRSELRDFRFSIAGSKTRNVKEGSLLRKEIARILTVLNQSSDK